MLTIVVPTTESFNEATNEFVTTGFSLDLEHSLASLSKWESKFCVPFLSGKERSPEETLWYIKCMTLTPNVPPEVFHSLTKDNIAEIVDYINAKMTATFVSDTPGAPGTREIITSELIYYWMITLGIPFECQNWHLNRLLMLIKVCNRKNSPPKKMNRRDMAARNRQLNAERRSRLGTSG